jgi:hypothetical protein
MRNAPARNSGGRGMLRVSLQEIAMDTGLAVELIKLLTALIGLIAVFASRKR